MTTITPLHHIRVALERNPYDVVIGDGGLARLGQQMLEAGVQAGRRVLVVSNPDVASPYGDACLKSLKDAGFSAELLVIDAGSDSDQSVGAGAGLDGPRDEFHRHRAGCQ